MSSERYYYQTNTPLYPFYLGVIMAKYSKEAQQKVEKVMHEFKQGKLKSGRSHQKVTSRKKNTCKLI